MGKNESRFRDAYFIQKNFDFDLSSYVLKYSKIDPLMYFKYKFKVQIPKYWSSKILHDSKTLN